MTAAPLVAPGVFGEDRPTPDDWCDRCAMSRDECGCPAPRGNDDGCPHGLPLAHPCRDCDEPERPAEDPGPGPQQTAWANPLPIVVGSLIAFPTDAMPPGMAAAIREVADMVAVDPAVPGTAFLGAAAAAIGPATEYIVSPTWRGRCNLYVAVVAASGDGKSPGMAYAVDPLHTLDDRAREAGQADARTAGVVLPALKRDLDTMQRAAVPQVAAMSALAAEIQRHERAQRRDARLLVDDATPERLAELLADNPAGLCAWSDEGGLLHHLTGLYSKSPNAGPYLKAWDSSRLVVDRKGGSGSPRTALAVEAPVLTVVAAVQPSTVAAMGSPENRWLVERGVAGRLLIAWPQSTAGRRILAGRPVARARHVDPWNGHVLRVAGHGPAQLPLDDAARALFLDWHDRVEAGLPAGHLYGDVREAAVKIRGCVPRIAALLARLDDCTMVSADHIGRAIEVGTYYLGHAQAVVESWAGRPTQVALALLGRISGVVDERGAFSVRDATRSVRQPVAVIVDALELLHVHGYVRPADPRVGFGVAADRRIGRQAPVVLAHPSLWAR